jgi:hypothetical protein
MEPTMKIYTADFRTDINYASREFTARSPRSALTKARAFSEADADALSFEHYSGTHPISEIVIYGAAGDEVASWQDDDLRLRLAAGDLLDALELCVECLADLSRLDDGTPSVSALIQARAAIAKAKGDAEPADAVRKLPPDPDKMNADRAQWAAVALRHFQCVTGSDYEDSLGDLLGDLMHWSDRNNFDFEAALCRARGHYAAETAGERP